MDGIDGDKLAVWRPSGMEVVADIDRIAGGLVMAECSKFDKLSCRGIYETRKWLLMTQKSSSTTRRDR